MKTVLSYGRFAAFAVMVFGAGCPQAPNGGNGSNGGTNGGTNGGSGGNGNGGSGGNSNGGGAALNICATAPDFDFDLAAAGAVATLDEDGNPVALGQTEASALGNSLFSEGFCAFSLSAAAQGTIDQANALADDGDAEGAIAALVELGDLLTALKKRDESDLQLQEDLADARQRVRDLVALAEAAEAIETGASVTLLAGARGEFEPATTEALSGADVESGLTISLEARRLGELSALESQSFDAARSASSPALQEAVRGFDVCGGDVDDIRSLLEQVAVAHLLGGSLEFESDALQAASQADLQAAGTLGVFLGLSAVSPSCGGSLSRAQGDSPLGTTVFFDLTTCDDAQWTLELQIEGTIATTPIDLSGTQVFSLSAGQTNVEFTMNATGQLDALGVLQPATEVVAVTLDIQAADGTVTFTAVSTGDGTVEVPGFGTSDIVTISPEVTVTGSLFDNPECAQ